MEKLSKNQPIRTAAILATAMSLGVTSSFAGEGVVNRGGGGGIVDRQISLYTERAFEAETALKEGDALYQAGKRQEALSTYQRGLNILPNAPAFADRRDALTGRVATASLALAQEKRKTGAYKEAEALLNEVLLIDPDNEKAMLELERIMDPGYSNPGLSPQHVENVRTVSALLAKGEGYYNLGLYDQAIREFEAVLRVDPYNRAARRFMETVETAKSRYYDSAYDQARIKLLNEVAQAWELQVAPVVITDLNPTDPTIKAKGASAILQDLKTIRVSLDFQETPVDDAIEYLRGQARDAGAQINFLINTPSTTGGAAPLVGDEDAPPAVDPGTKVIRNLRLNDVPMLEALKYITEATGLRYKVDEYAVQLLPAGIGGDGDLYTRTFSVPPNFYPALSSLDDGSGSADPFGGGGDPFGDDGGGSRIKPRESIDTLLKKAGVTFEGDASATYIALTSTLVVRNSSANLDLVEAIIEDIRRQTPKQIKVSTKFVEITQVNTDELGFDWLVSPISLDSGGTSFLGGGTIGNGATRTSSDFINPVNGVFLPGIPLQDGVPVDGSVTGGLRSGQFAITSDSIDSIVNNPTRSAQQQQVAPGILNFTGIFSDGIVNVVLRGLSQKKGADIMTAPSIMARPGETATIEIIREFIYPTEYEPPQLPNQVGAGGFVGGGAGGGGGGTGGAFPVTPATPAAFETRNTGITLEIEPSLGDNDYVIDLRFAPEIVEFEGFINYGSPIQASATDALGNTNTLTITENRIEMPVFSSRRVNTSLTIYDGHTVAIGGLIREEVEKVEDKVPILGDLPLIGRLFQSTAENRDKSNLVIFVSANIIDATGRPLRDTNGTPTENPSLLPGNTDPVGLPGDFPSF